jgi:hypothetical protein
MIKTPYHFEADLSDQEFQKIGQFACRWALIEHTIGNCLRVMLGMNPKHATIMIFPLSLDHRMTRIRELLARQPTLLNDYQRSVLEELRPLIRAMQYLRNTALHGVVVSDGDDADRTYFHLRSRGRNLNRKDLFSCEDLINYAAHVTNAFRLSLGEKTIKGSEDGHPYELPQRPPIPDFLPEDCRKFPKDDTGLLREGKAVQ